MSLDGIKDIGNFDIVVKIERERKKMMTYFRLLACWEKDVNIYQQIQKSDLLSVNLEIWQASFSSLQIWKSFFFFLFWKISNQPLSTYSLQHLYSKLSSDTPMHFSHYYYK